MRNGIVFSVWIVLLFAGCGDTVTSGQEATETTYTFQRDIYPILHARCRKCHGSNGNYSVTTPEETYDLLLHTPPRASTGYDAFIVPGDPQHSLLFQKAQNIELHGGGEQIAPGSDAAKMLRAWILRGAPYDTNETAMNTQ